MTGRGKTNTSVTIKSSKYLSTASTLTSLIGAPRAPMQREWPLGTALTANGNVKLEALAGELGYIGCQICCGFGHSKTACLTYNSLRLIQKR